MAEKSNIEFPSYSPSNSEKRNVIANAAFIAAMAGSLASCKANSNKELYTVQEPTPVTQPLDNDDIEIFNNKTQEEFCLLYTSRCV